MDISIQYTKQIEPNIESILAHFHSIHACSV